MKVTLLLLLVVVSAVMNQSEALWPKYKTYRRYRWPRVLVHWLRVHRLYNLYRFSGKRAIDDIAELDKNLDGLLDQVELEKIMSTRAAQEFLETVTNDGESTISTAEFEELFRNLREIKN